VVCVDVVVVVVRRRRFERCPCPSRAPTLLEPVVCWSSSLELALLGQPDQQQRSEEVWRVSVRRSDAGGAGRLVRGCAMGYRSRQKFVTSNSKPHKVSVVAWPCACVCVCVRTAMVGERAMVEGLIDSVDRRDPTSARGKTRAMRRHHSTRVGQGTRRPNRIAREPKCQRGHGL
jgi:hypothetical protein